MNYYKWEDNRWIKVDEFIHIDSFKYKIEVGKLVCYRLRTKSHGYKTLCFDSKIVNNKYWWIGKILK